MRIILVTRFSIADPRYVSKNGRVDVFNPTRMEEKFKAFEDLTLPSILAQTFKKWQWYIYTSDRIPSSYRERLDKLIEETNMGDKINIVAVKDVDEYNNHFERVVDGLKVKYATVRLDDDDAIACDYFEHLQKYSKEKKGLIISPVKGYLVFFDSKDKKWKGHKYEYYPQCIAFGLARIGDNILKCGNHYKIHRKYPVKYVKTGRSYLRSSGTCNKSNQSKFAELRKKCTPFDISKYLTNRQFS